MVIGLAQLTLIGILNTYQIQPVTQAFVLYRGAIMTIYTSCIVKKIIVGLNQQLACQTAESSLVSNSGRPYTVQRATVIVFKLQALLLFSLRREFPPLYG